MVYIYPNLGGYNNFMVHINKLTVSLMNDTTTKAIWGQVKKLGNNIIFVKKSYRNTRHKIITEHISSRADEIF